MLLDYNKMISFLKRCIDWFFFIDIYEDNHIPIVNNSIKLVKPNIRDIISEMYIKNTTIFYQEYPFVIDNPWIIPYAFFDVKITSLTYIIKITKRFPIYLIEYIGINRYEIGIYDNNTDTLKSHNDFLLRYFDYYPYYSRSSIYP